jgi:transposase
MSPAIRKLVRNEEAIVEAYRKGQTLRTIAEFYNVSHGTIKNILDRRGETMRARGRKRKERENPALTDAISGLGVAVGQPQSLELKEN